MEHEICPSTTTETIRKTFTKLLTRIGYKNLISKTVQVGLREEEREATIKYHKIFQFNYEKFLLPMHDIYEIIMFSSTNPPTAFRIQSNRDNMNFFLLLSWKCFLRDSIIRSLDFLFQAPAGKEFVGIKFFLYEWRSFLVVSSMRSLSYVENFRF